MKKICAIVVMLAPASVLMFAKGEVTPQAYLASRGLMVMDEDQVYAAFGADDIGGDFFTDWFPRETFGIFIYDEYSYVPMIIFRNCGILYLAVEMAALWGNGSMSAKTVSEIYSDFCQEYPFDILMATNDGHSGHLCAENSDTYDELQSFLNSEGDTSSTLYDREGAFFDTVLNFTR